jgi:cleavage and polyadenylation specificity factor subunit 1
MLELHRPFDECKASLSRATLLAHPDPTSPLVLVTDTSNSAMGAILQQRVDNVWEPITFSKKLNLAQQKFSTCDHELLAIYKAVKHFHHILEARHFVIFTDHMPITYTFQQKGDKLLPWQFNHLDFIAQFTTDVHISGQDVTSALFCIESVTAPPSHNTLAALQDIDDKL